MSEEFTPDERSRLAPYFSNLDSNIFALTNLPETVKGALFARYSRSAKSLRRLFLDEFAEKIDVQRPSCARRHDRRRRAIERAERLYARVFSDYGDDSVAQLGGAHIACEYVSNVLTKVLEWGRLMAYLEQSTRYVPYTDKLHDRWRYHIPDEIGAGPLRDEYVATMDGAFETYAKWIPPMQEHFARRYPKSASDSDGVHRAAIRAKALDTLRGMLPAATQSNVGIFGTGQAFEMLLLRMRANPLAEVRECADRMLEELRKVIPAFLTRVDQPDRGGRWSEYFAGIRKELDDVAMDLAAVEPEPRDEVTLTDFDAEGETKVVAAALYGSPIYPTTSSSTSRVVYRRTSGSRSFVPTSASARTAGTGQAAPSSAPAIGSTCSPITARFAICNDIDCSRWNGSRSRRATDSFNQKRSSKPARSTTGTASWTAPRRSTSEWSAPG